jgi:hypothetical protein
MRTANNETRKANGRKKCHNEMPKVIREKSELLK